ncbi:hypothetical protein Pr1d_31750 [Bythopirellula goksoeyrii]|uniref:Uncharacterized protein n=1 Tax=Bythopirellula goksoeyrii TaxID=1400387 RepID=A0A5B9QDJ2_9BACT|nr:hypothetical protein Pr1d_31750 [Bythopirellula goksoeyrii]
MLVDSCINRLFTWHYLSVSMFYRARRIRNVVAVCLALWMPCPATLAGQCLCSGCRDTSSCRISTTATGASLCCTACASKCCGNECKSEPNDKQPCSCQCHQTPFTALARSGQASSSLSDFAAFGCFWQLKMTIEPMRAASVLSSFVISHSRVDACILLCRLLI